jgi:hypothetical protein
MWQSSQWSVDLPWIKRSQISSEKLNGPSTIRDFIFISSRELRCEVVSGYGKSLFFPFADSWSNGWVPLVEKEFDKEFNSNTTETHDSIEYIPTRIKLSIKVSLEHQQL